MSWYQFMLEEKDAERAHMAVMGGVLPDQLHGQNIEFSNAQEEPGERVDVATKLMNANIPFRFQGGDHT